MRNVSMVFGGTLSPLWRIMLNRLLFIRGSISTSGRSPSVRVDAVILIGSLRRTWLPVSIAITASDGKLFLELVVNVSVMVPSCSFLGSTITMLVLSRVPGIIRTPLTFHALLTVRAWPISRIQRLKRNSPSQCGLVTPDITNEIKVCGRADKTAPTRCKINIPLLLYDIWLDMFGNKSGAMGCRLPSVPNTEPASTEASCHPNESCEIAT